MYKRAILSNKRAIQFCETFLFTNLKFALNILTNTQPPHTDLASVYNPQPTTTYQTRT